MLIYSTLQRRPRQRQRPLILMVCYISKFSSCLLSLSLLLLLLLIGNNNGVDCSEVFAPRQCEPIRIDMCRGIGYNETAMPNLVGHELQADVEFTLQTFLPLIEYVCSTQLKLFLCAAYVPMCTPKVAMPIGPCRSLCETVRARCHPVLQGFGFPWPPALDCARFPRENNHETMCMEGPGEVQHAVNRKETEIDTIVGVGGSGIRTPNMAMPSLECPGVSKAHLYVKLYRSGRCAPLCEADILFSQDEKHLADVWVATWSYAALGLAIVATMCLLVGGDNTKNSAVKWSHMLTPLVWCHNLVAVGWTVRFISGRVTTSCGIDPQAPNVSLLLVDGLSNAACATTFLLRYYFGMAACAWWAILCLGWHREVRRNSPEIHGHISSGAAFIAATDAGQSALNEQRGKPRQPRSTLDSLKRDYDVTRSNLARFSAWGIPAFQTAAVLAARLVDADELFGACFVGNQSDVGLQILVATPLFCYWIFGSMNLISGYLVHRRNKELLKSNHNAAFSHLPQNVSPGMGVFLIIYCAPCGLMLLAVIYEFANIDIWLNVPAYYTALQGLTTPMWPFLTRAFMELMLGIICCAWVLGPKISTAYKRQRAPLKPLQVGVVGVTNLNAALAISRPAQAYSTVSYHSVRHATPPNSTTCTASGTLSMSQRTSRTSHKYATPSSSIGHLKSHKSTRGHHKNNLPKNFHQQAHQSHHEPQSHFMHRYGNETIL